MTQTEAERRESDGEQKVALKPHARFRRRKVDAHQHPALEHAFVAWVKPYTDGGIPMAHVTLMGLHHQVELLISAEALQQIAAAAEPHEDKHAQDS
jgi:hypothetical protein